MKEKPNNLPPIAETETRSSNTSFQLCEHGFVFIVVPCVISQSVCSLQVKD